MRGEEKAISSVLQVMLSEQIIAASMRLLKEQEVMATMSPFFGGLVGGARRSNHEECFNCFLWF